jgi:diaminopimelate decarboxylase
MFTKTEINQFKNLETPFYYYNRDILSATLKECKHAADQYNYKVHYALKANANDEILTIIKDHGFGADCVSGNEVKKALEIGFTPKEVVFAGVGKSDKEINESLDADIFCFNVESLHEMHVLNDLAKNKNTKARIALRINPNVNANTHHYITTGLEENKFGINAWELETIIDLLKMFTHLELTGLHFHIGSQITDLNVFKSLCIRVNEFQQWFEKKRIKISVLNVGGGLGVNYQEPDRFLIPDFKSYFKIFNEFIERLPDQEVHFELGRALVAQCGSLISKVLYIKHGVKTNFAILDAGMTELLRPALYQAFHYIENISKTPNSQLQTQVYDVVGPICESSDCFGKAVELPETERGDLIAIRTAGAYGEVMASQYNLRDRVKAYYSH